VGLGIPGVEEPTAAGPTSPGGGAHDEGDPADALGDEEVWATASVPVGSAGSGAGTVGPTSGSAAQEPPADVEHAAPEASPTMEIGPGRPVRA
jgi:hypothetical protein